MSMTFSLLLTSAVTRRSDDVSRMALVDQRRNDIVIFSNNTGHVLVCTRVLVRDGQLTSVVAQPVWFDHFQNSNFENQLGR